MPQRRRLRTAAAKNPKRITTAKFLGPICARIPEIPCIFAANREFGFQSTSSQLTPFSSRESANHRFLSYSRGAVKSAAVSEGEIAVASTEQLHSAALSGKGLMALWHALPGIEQR